MGENLVRLVVKLRPRDGTEPRLTGRKTKARDGRDPRLTGRKTKARDGRDPRLTGRKTKAPWWERTSSDWS